MLTFAKVIHLVNLKNMHLLILIKTIIYQTYYSLIYPVELQTKIDISMKNELFKISSLLLIVLITFSCKKDNNDPAAESNLIIDHKCTTLGDIPEEWINKAKTDLHIAYDHTSHGRQLIIGMNGLRDLVLNDLNGYKGDIYNWNDGGTSEALDIDDYFTSVDDLGYEDDWAPATRTYLNDPENSNVNVVMWSWCNIYGHDIDKYLTNMETLISEYGPGGSKIVDGTRTVPVTFVFMTGHTYAGTTENQWTFNANKQIRQHCIDNKRVLYDFYDIECYNPDGDYFGDGEPNLANYGTYNGLKDLEDDCTYDLNESTRGNWALEWQDSNDENVDWYTCPTIPDHTQHLN